MAHVIGNWSVDKPTADSITTPKSLEVPDLSYATDFSVTTRQNGEVRLANTTGSGILPMETLRYGRSTVANIYNGVEVAEAMKSKIKQGVRTLCEIRYFLKASNTVSGEEILLPLRGWVCLEVPTVDFISGEEIDALLKRTVSASLKTGSVNGALVTDVARGDLDPSA
jgi:hypothetical protein